MRFRYAVPAVLVLGAVFGGSVMAGAGDPPPAKPDLDVVIISISPRLPSYAPIYYDGFGHPSDPENPNREITLEQSQAKKRYHDPGDIVTFTARVVNHGGVATAPFTYTWKMDGVEIGSGSHPGLDADARATGTDTLTYKGFDGNPNGPTFVLATLEPGTFAEFSVQWAWQDGPHDISFSCRQEDGAPAEISSRNNTRTERTDASAFFISVLRSYYNNFRGVQNHTTTGGNYPDGYGSYSLEDWIQYHVDLMHDKFKKSVYPTAPNGIEQRIRIEDFLILDDASPRKNIDNYRAVNGFDSGWAFNQYPPPSMAQQYDWGLPHEWGHQLGLMDLYNLDLTASDILTLDLDGYPVGLNRNAHQGGMMRGHGDTNFSEACAVAMNSQLGRRRGWYGDFQYLIPLRNRVLALDNTGQPVAGAEISAYQGKPLAEEPVFQGVTDAQGYFDMPNRPAPHITPEYKPGAPVVYTQHDNPFGTVDVVGNRNVLLFRVRKGDLREFFWLDITDFNLAYWRTGPDTAVYPMRTHFPPAGAPAPPVGLAVRPNGATAARLTWNASPDLDITGYRIYRAIEPFYEWTRIVTSVPPTTLTYSTSLNTGTMARYAVTSLRSGVESAFCKESGTYIFNDLRGITVKPDGSIIASDYPREQPIWLRPDYSPISAFGSVHNHVCTMDVAVTPNGNIASIGGPVGYIDHPVSGLLEVMPDGRNTPWGATSVFRVLRDIGANEGNWNIPEGLSVGIYGDYIITDKNNKRVEVLSGGNRSTLMVFGADTLTRPIKTIQLEDDTYLTTDPGAGQIVRFDPYGNVQDRISMTVPGYIAVSPEGIIAVSRTSSNTITLLNRDFSVWRSYTRDHTGTALSKPQGIAFAPNGDLIIGDNGSRRVTRLKAWQVSKIGDVDGNDFVEAEDVFLSLKIAAGLAAGTPEQVERGDLVRESEEAPFRIDIADSVALIRRWGT